MNQRIKKNYHNYDLNLILKLRITIEYNRVRLKVNNLNNLIKMKLDFLTV